MASSLWRRTQTQKDTQCSQALAKHSSINANRRAASLPLPSNAPPPPPQQQVLSRAAPHPSPCRKMPHGGVQPPSPTHVPSVPARCCHTQHMATAPAAGDGLTWEQQDCTQGAWSALTQLPPALKYPLLIPFFPSLSPLSAPDPRPSAQAGANLSSSCRLIR